MGLESNSIVMKLSLPGFLKRREPADDQPVSKSMPQLTGDIKPASLGKVRLQLLIAGVVLLGALAQRRARLDGGPQHVAGGDLWNGVLLRNERRLGSLPGAGST